MGPCLVLAVVTFLLVACAGTSTPLPDLTPVQSEAKDIVEGPPTETAPSATSAPTDTATPGRITYTTRTARPSSTHSPSPTGAPTATSTPTPTRSPTPTSTPLSGLPAVDRVVAYNPGPGTEPGYTDPEAALGLPDLVESPCCTGMVQLGRGGSLLLAFVDNALVDGDGPDLQISGESAQDDYLLVEVSNDGREWYAYPQVSESPAGLDLEDTGLAQAVYVRLTDVQPGTSSGAEIDAIVALHSGPGILAPLPDLPDAVARVELLLREGPDKRMAEVGRVGKGTALMVDGRSPMVEWIKVENGSGTGGWCRTSDLALNVTVGTYPIAPSPATPTPAQPTLTPAPQTTVWLVFIGYAWDRRWPHGYERTWLGTFKVNPYTLETVELEERENFTRWQHNVTVSPDGKWVAESSSKGRNDGATELYIRRVDDSAEFKLVGDPLLYVEFGGWSPAGQWLVFRARQGAALGVANVQTREVKILVECPYPPTPGSEALLQNVGCISWPVWLPGGEFIAFSMWMDDDGGGDIDSQNDSMDLFWIGRNGSDLRNLTNTPGTNEWVMGWIRP